MNTPDTIRERLRDRAQHVMELLNGQEFPENLKGEDVQALSLWAWSPPMIEAGQRDRVIALFQGREQACIDEGDTDAGTDARTRAVALVETLEGGGGKVSSMTQETRLVPVEAVQRLILAADSYGVRYLDSDDMTTEAEELQAATEAMKDILAAPALPAAAPQILKGVGKIDGDGWKDTTRKGEVVFVWNAEKPKPYSPGQYPRVGNEGWAASVKQYDFTPATVDEIKALFALPAAEAVAWRYQFSDPMSGKPVWRYSPSLWNGQRPTMAMPLYAHLASDASTEKSDPDDVTAPSSGVPARKGGSARMKTLHPDASALREAATALIAAEDETSERMKEAGISLPSYPEMDALRAALSQGEA